MLPTFEPNHAQNQPLNDIEEAKQVSNDIRFDNLPQRPMQAGKVFFNYFCIKKTSISSISLPFTMSELVLVRGDICYDPNTACLIVKRGHWHY